tara:strand:- start:1010 stop:1570 length:561 start_codon:yes stop_codon:yes gene_type:complete
MSPKILIIFEYQILFEILDEIHKSLNFKIIKCNENEYKNIQFDPKIDYLVISKKNISGVKNLLVLGDKIIKLEKLLEIININFLKNKFFKQSNITIGKYNLDLNSRIISFENKNLDLTEREINLIIFIYDKKDVTVKDLQKSVWDYSLDLETHTVETHIYRLRKKMNEVFGDENFILNNKNGYSIH